MVRYHVTKQLPSRQPDKNTDFIGTLAPFENANNVQDKPYESSDFMGNMHLANSEIGMDQYEGHGGLGGCQNPTPACGAWNHDSASAWYDMINEEMWTRGAQAVGSEMCEMFPSTA